MHTKTLENVGLHFHRATHDAIRDQLVEHLFFMQSVPMFCNKKEYLVDKKFLFMNSSKYWTTSVELNVHF